MNRMMKQLEIRPMRLLAGACSLVLILGAAHAGLGQQRATTRTQTTDLAQRLATASTLAPSLDAFANAAKPAAEEEEESPKPNSAGHQGVKVHGHWVLQVKNADGTLGERREFENSLVNTSTTLNGAPLSTSGSELMVGMLSGNLTVGDPGIGFIQGDISGDPSLFCNLGTGSSASSSCYVFTSTNSLWNIGFSSGGIAALSTGLSYMAYFTLAPVPQIVLSGNYTVPAGLTSIAAVQSLYGMCIPRSSYSGSSPWANGNDALTGSTTFRHADTAPVNCISSNLGFGASIDSYILGALTSTAVTSNVSGTPVPTPMAVTPGQVVQVTVQLSFS